MNALELFAGLDWWSVAGWTMLHYLWLGALLGVAAAGLRLFLWRADANVRYAAALVCLTALAVLPVGLAVWVGRNAEEVSGVARGIGVEPLAKPQAIEREVLEGIGPEIAHRAEPTTKNEKTISAPATNLDLRYGGTHTRPNPRQSRGLTAALEWSPFVEMAAEWMPWVWIVGTPVTFLMLVSGVVGAERLRRESRQLVDGPIAECAARLMASLRIGQRVSLAVCERVAAPVLVGVVRPIILLPPAALTGWSPDEIEMVLLHELAHVRRWDNLVNLAQRLVESALFFQPAVWLVSSWVRREREACCDAIVVGRTNGPQAYAELLVALAAQLPRSVLFHPTAASAMASGPLRVRIRRILGIKDDPMLVSGKSLGIVMCGLLLAASLVVLNLPNLSKAKETAADDANTSARVADALEKYRQVVVGYDLDFDAVFPKLPLTSYVAERLRRYPTPQAWPDVLGHIDTDAGAFREIRERPGDKFEKVTGGNAWLVPLDWSVGTENYATLLFLNGIEADAHVVAHSYTSFASFGTMAGDALFKSYATALVNGDLSGQITADSYFNLVVTGKFTGRIYTDTYAMVYLMGGLSGTMEINNSKVYIAGSTQRAALRHIRGPGKVYLEESDLPAGEHQIGELVVTVKARTEKFADAAKAATKDLFLQEVQFVVGASKFAEGDSITITSVHGTSDTFKPGNTYWIEGTYTLASRDSAELMASVTAKNAVDRTGARKSARTKNVQRGSGKFSLELHMTGAGWPHVSFYPAEGGQSFGGVYFGTGESALTKWWDEKEGTAKGTEKKTVEEVGLPDTDGLFVVSDDNPEETRSYALLSKERDALLANFESLRRGGLGVDMPFAYTASKEQDDVVEVVAARAAHDKFFAGYVSQFDAGMIAPVKMDGASPSNAGTTGAFAAEDIGKNAKKETRPIESSTLVETDEAGGASSTELLSEDELLKRDMQPSDKERISFVARRKFIPTTENVVETRHYEITDSSRAVLDLDSVTAVLNTDQSEPRPVWGFTWSNDFTKLKVIAPREGQKFVVALLRDALAPTAEFTADADQADRTASTKTPNKFPTLEEQKLADLAWERLGLELEAIDGAELKRVQALGYEGGLRIAGSRDAMRRSVDFIAPNFAAGEILVGLHVWPTRSLQDVAAVLRRDDLEQLNPLKFYSVRQEAVANESSLGGGRGDQITWKDRVRSGRISVLRESSGNGGARSTTTRSSERPRVVQATPQPIPLGSMKQSTLDVQGKPPIDNASTVDPNLEMMQHELVSLEYQLSAEAGRTKTEDTRESKRLRALIAAKRKNIDDYRRQAPKRQAKANAPELKSRVDELPSNELVVSDEVEAILREAGPLRLEFYYVDDSEPCRRMRELLRAFRRANLSLPVEIVATNAEVDQASAIANDVTSVPAIGIRRNGKPVKWHIGELNASELIKFFDELAQKLSPVQDSNSSTDATAPGVVTYYQTVEVPKLYYEGKTFDEWQTAWKTELSTERRIEAVKALAAFGANGFGKEAAEAIVEVAVQYDWKSNLTEPEERIKMGCMSALGADLGTNSSYHVPTKDALTALLGAAESQNANSRLLAAWILPYFLDDQRSIDALAKLRDDPDAAVRSFGFRGSSPATPRPSTAHFPEERSIPSHVFLDLLSNNPQTTRAAIQSLVKDADWYRGQGIAIEQDGPVLNFDWNFFPLLFSPDEGVQKEARKALRFLKDSDSHVVGQLEDFLSVESRRKDRLEAIRALAALGPKASRTTNRLKQLLVSDDPETRIAAAAAIKMIVGKDQYQKPVAEMLGEELGIEVVESNGVWGALPRKDINDGGKAFNEFTEAVIKEQQELFPDGKF